MVCHKYVISSSVLDESECGLTLYTEIDVGTEEDITLQAREKNKHRCRNRIGFYKFT